MLSYGEIAMNPIIKSQVGQKLTSEIKSKIKDAFWTAFNEWEEEGQTDLDGQYILTVCENIQVSENEEDFIAIPIDFEDRDGGYLEVYGLREIEN